MMGISFENRSDSDFDQGLIATIRVVEGLTILGLLDGLFAVVRVLGGALGLRSSSRRRDKVR
jgi:hypothetical protein